MSHSHCWRYAFPRKPPFPLLRKTLALYRFPSYPQLGLSGSVPCPAEMSIGHNAPLSGQAPHLLSSHLVVLLPTEKGVETTVLQVLSGPLLPTLVQAAAVPTSQAAWNTSGRNSLPCHASSGKGDRDAVLEGLGKALFSTPSGIKGCQ